MLCSRLIRFSAVVQQNAYDARRVARTSGRLVRTIWATRLVLQRVAIDRELVRVRITAEDCPRISREFLEEARRSLDDRWFRQEYLCMFEATSDAVFLVSLWLHCTIGAQIGVDLVTNP